jgi:hypothetical protein
MTNALIDKVNEIRNAASRPGVQSGTVMDRCARHAGAPSNWAASVSRWSRFCIVPNNVRAVTGSTECSRPAATRHSM